MSRGPMPKRSDERTRRNATGEDGLAIKKGEALPYAWPEANPAWEFETEALYLSFQESGMREYYQTTDVQWIWTACQEYDDYRKSGRRSAMQLQAVLSMFGQGLGITEGDRRRIKIELEAPDEGVPDDTAEKVVDMKNRLKKRA